MSSDISLNQADLMETRKFTIISRPLISWQSWTDNKEEALNFVLYAVQRKG